MEATELALREDRHWLVHQEDAAAVVCEQASARIPGQFSFGALTP